MATASRMPPPVKMRPSATHFHISIPLEALSLRLMQGPFGAGFLSPFATASAPRIVVVARTPESVGADVEVGVLGATLVAGFFVGVCFFMRLTSDALLRSVGAFSG